MPPEVAERSRVAGPFVDAAFSMKGSQLPLDHGYALFSSVSKIVPELHQRPHWGLHPVRGLRSGPGQLQLLPDSTLKIRLPAAEIAPLLALAGTSLEVQGHRIDVGVPRLHPLIPAATIRARFVT